MRMDVPEMTIIHVKGAGVFHAVPGYLTLEEAAAELGYDPGRVEMVLQDGPLAFNESPEKNICKYTAHMCGVGARWFRDRMSQELGRK